jgi:hypothetical protein
MSGNGAGKGSRYRRVDPKLWSENYDRIFRAKNRKGRKSREAQPDSAPVRRRSGEGER